MSSNAAERNEPSGEPATLTISDVAARTGMSVGGLRNWESRYGVPRPGRSGGGQRRYRESDCRLIADIIRRRDSGVAVAVAVRQALEQAGSVGETSIFHAVRRSRADLPVHRLDKDLILALTWAMEDQCCSLGENPILIGAFQRAHHFESSRQRWESMAATSEQAIAFADFEGLASGTGKVAQVPITAASPLSREWALVSDSPNLPACLLAWEPPGQERLPDRRRQFEMVWSVSPDVVRQAARVGVAIAARAVPELDRRLGARLAESAPAASADMRRAQGVFDRTLDYLFRARTP